VSTAPTIATVGLFGAVLTGRIVPHEAGHSSHARSPAREC
jgi:hypothetical protein